MMNKKIDTLNCVANYDTKKSINIKRGSFITKKNEEQEREINFEFS